MVLLCFIFFHLCDQAMLAAVLMLVFMNLAASVHPKLGEISFMNTFGLWALTVDAKPAGAVAPLSKHQRIQIVLDELQQARDDPLSTVSSMGALSNALPHMKMDDEVRSCNTHSRLFLPEERGKFPLSCRAHQQHVCPSFASEQVLVDLGIHRNIGGHAEASMILCGALMRIAAIAFLAEKPTLGVGIFCV